MAQRQAAIEAAAAAGRAEPTFGPDGEGDDDLFETGAPEDRGVVSYDDIHRHDEPAFHHDDEPPFEVEAREAYLGTTSPVAGRAHRHGRG